MKDSVWNQIENIMRLQKGLQLRSLIGLTFSSYGRLLTPGAISLLLHLCLMTFLVVSLKPIHTKGESVVYRVTLQVLPSKSDFISKTTPPPIPVQPRIQEKKSRPKQSTTPLEVNVDKKISDSEIKPPTQATAPEPPPPEEQKQSLRSEAFEQTPIPLPLGELSTPVKENIKTEDGSPVHISLSRSGAENQNTISESELKDQSGEGSRSGGRSADGSGKGPGGSLGNGSGTGRGFGIGGSGDGPGQGVLGWKASGAGGGIGRGGSGGSGSDTGIGQGGSGGKESANYGTIVSHPRHAENPKPTYPLEARQKGYKGEVLLKLEVLSNGRVGQIEIKKSSGHEILDRSALSAVKEWRFIPAQRGGVAISCWVNIPVKFELQ